MAFMKKDSVLFVMLFLTLLTQYCYSLKREDCEVCFKTIENFVQTLSEKIKKDPSLIEAEFKNYCKTVPYKEQRFCYYLGGRDDSATSILKELSKPISWSMPVDKICEKLKKKDAQICDLRYEKELNLDSESLRKYKVRDLKKILSNWNDDCEGCIEKIDFIKRIEELKPKYVKQEL